MIKDIITKIIQQRAHDILYNEQGLSDKEPSDARMDEAYERAEEELFQDEDMFSELFTEELLFREEARRELKDLIKDIYERKEEC